MLSRSRSRSVETVGYFVLTVPGYDQGADAGCNGQGPDRLLDPGELTRCPSRWLLRSKQIKTILLIVEQGLYGKGYAVHSTWWYAREAQLASLRQAVSPWGSISRKLPSLRRYRHLFR